MQKIVTPALLALIAATAPAFATEPAENAFNEIKVEAGEALFDAECRRCHATDSTDPSYGPPLENVVGRPAGSVADYPYSDALQSSGIVWTSAALRAWIEDNDGFMPGTKMRHVGILDHTVQDFILSYLDSITVAD